MSGVLKREGKSYWYMASQRRALHWVQSLRNWLIKDAVLCYL